jgi:hypothetical protein
MTRKIAVLATAFALGGCIGNGSSDHPNIYHCCIGQRVVGNETYVTVSNVWNEMDALPLADNHCAGFGKVARFNHMEGHRAIFDCVVK